MVIVSHTITPIPLSVPPCHLPLSLPLWLCPPMPLVRQLLPNILLPPVPLVKQLLPNILLPPKHSQKLIGVLWHFNPLALVASYVAHDNFTQNINTGNCGGKIKLSTLKRNNFLRLPIYLDIHKNMMLHFLRLPPQRLSYLPILEG